MALLQFKNPITQEDVRLSESEEKLTDVTSYANTNEGFVRELELSKTASECAEGTVEEAKLDRDIAYLQGKLKNIHPLIAFKRGEVQIENPEMQLPISFKLIEPALKVLNDKLLGMSLTDQFLADIRSLLMDSFGIMEPRPWENAEGTKNKAPLQILQLDFKGGKAILDLRSFQLDRLDPWGDFSRRVAAFQHNLTLLLEIYMEKVGEKDFHPGEQKANMIFDAIDWGMVKDPSNPTDEEILFILNFAEQGCNVTRGRFAEQPKESERTRSHCSRHYTKKVPAEVNEGRTEDKKIRTLFQYIQHDFQRAFTAFLDLHHQTDGQEGWDHIIEPTPFDEDAPQLTEEYLDVIRKGKRGTPDDPLPFVTDAQYQIIKKFYDTVNVADVLKPYILKHKEAFISHIDEIVALLDEKPQTLEEKRAYYLKLMKRSEDSIKNTDVGGTRAKTRLGFIRAVYENMCTEGKASEELSIILGDLKGFGAFNSQVLYWGMLRALHTPFSDDMTEEEVERVMKWVLSVGDEATEILRDVDVIVDNLFEGKCTIDASGGDELRILAASKDIEAKLAELDKLIRVRLAYYPLESGVNRSTVPLEDVASRVTQATLLSEEAFSMIKANVENPIIAGKPVKMIDRK